MFVKTLTGLNAHALFRKKTVRKWCSTEPPELPGHKIRKLFSHLSEAEIEALAKDPQKYQEYVNKFGVPFESWVKEQQRARHMNRDELFMHNMQNMIKKDGTEREEKEDEEDAKIEHEGKGKEPKPSFLDFEDTTTTFWLVMILLGIMAWRANERETKRQQSGPSKPPEPFSDRTVGFLKLIPTRYLSHLWGKFTGIHFPSQIQKFVINCYAYAFDCKLEEAEKDISDYPSLAEFFKRNLKPGVRPISPDAQLICPVDGRLVHYGVIEDETDSIEQVKNVNFSLKEFMGPNSEIFDVIKRHRESRESGVDPNKQLYYCVIYLAPGDYHGYHSPVAWKIRERIHFPGNLFPVASWAVFKLRGLFSMNERVVLNGEWKHGFFSYTPVGAYNVGSMTLKFEEEFLTNLREDSTSSPPRSKEYPAGVKVDKGDNIGFFNLGSSVVIIWESPALLFMFNRGEKIKLGETLTVEVTPEILEKQLQKLKDMQRKVEEERQAKKEFASLLKNPKKEE
eukprot:TRINITY_DN6466_c0_g1_i9.p1 TRINITY_DN6466_c0_g1~~TRINITY_DN6466_c0_g1_i9.p1  ORF type:complete len:509 (-),score=124.59 TRINITY_DN6466_c0_g1_i9:171-1697(-)